MFSAAERLGLATVRAVVPILVLLAAWQGLAHSGLVPIRLFPDVMQIGRAFGAFASSGDFLYHSGFTLYRALLAFVIAAPAGILLGTLLARSALAETMLEPIFTFGYPIPKIALFPLFLFAFGLGDSSKIPLTIVEALYPITLGTYYGMRSVDRTLIWAAENMAASPQRIFFRVLLPNALPAIFSSLRIGMHIALVVIILLEIIGDNSGLGYYLTYTTTAYDYPGFFAGILGIVIWGFLLDQGMLFLRNKIVFW